MSLDWVSPPLSLRTILRSVPPLAPEDSLRRFLQICRQYALSSLPVLRNGRLCGILSTQTIWPLLAIESVEERDLILDRPIAGEMSAPVALASPDMTLEEVGSLFALHHLDVIPVVDAGGYCLGLVSAFDLVLTDPTPPHPPLIGGMATPFGVYLTDGTRQAGAGNLALVASGVVMGLLYSLAYLIMSAGLRFVQTFTHFTSLPGLHLDYEPPAQQPWLGLLSVALSLLTTFIFLLLMRTSRLAGYHAAEHQTVHALEHGERLLPEVVQRMPRPHPRCGTNLMAAGLVFLNLAWLLRYVPYIDASSATLLAAVTTLFTWRHVGTFLQEKFTTRPASERQIRSGIEAANGLLQQFWNSPPSRTGFFRRVWCSGLLQVMVGMTPTLTLALSLADRLKL